MNKTKIFYQQPVFVTHPDREPKFSEIVSQAVAEDKTVVICVDGLTEKDAINVFEPRNKTPNIYVLHKDDKGMFITKYPDKVNDDVTKIVDPLIKNKDHVKENTN